MVFVVDNNNDEKKKKLLISNAQKIKKIEVGNFYLIHDGSLNGHPGLIIWKNDTHNLYLAIKFGSSLSKDNTKFAYSLSKDVSNSYYYKRLFLGKRKNFGSVILEKFNIKEKDKMNLLKKLDLSNPKYSPDIRRKDKRFYKWAIKNPLYQGQLSCPKGTS